MLRTDPEPPTDGPAPAAPAASDPRTAAGRRARSRAATGAMADDPTAEPAESVVPDEPVTAGDGHEPAAPPEPAAPSIRLDDDGEFPPIDPRLLSIATALTEQGSDRGSSGQRVRRAGRRPLRIFPFDPMVDRFGRKVIADVPYEPVERGPVGRLVEVIDYDTAHGCFYEPVDLDAPDVLRTQGLDLTEADPRFHQQMVYAVVMRVLESFESGLGRPLQWARNDRLRIYPHAFEGRNAFFDPDLFCLVFGYFQADATDPGANIPGQTVFTCLSHDIIAHETSHAVVHRLRPLYNFPTNPDVLAFHEGFADVVAILQHFMYPDVVAEHISQTKAKLTDATPLLELAEQFGYARGDNRALRTALTAPDKNAYLASAEAHDRGAVLAASVASGFLGAYGTAIADLLRLATDRPGALQPGTLHPELVQRISQAASDCASRVLEMSIRAFDYLPPVDVTFSDYLRALVTADFDVFPDDMNQLRSSVIEGFRSRGVYPSNVVSLAEGSLRIEPADPNDFDPAPGVSERILDTALAFDHARNPGRIARDEAQARQNTERWARGLHRWAVTHRRQLQLEADLPIQVKGFHTSQRTDAEGYMRSIAILQFVQRDADAADELGGVAPMGGTTVIADSEGRVQYVIAKPVPTAGTPARDELRTFLIGLEHELRTPAWRSPATRRITDRLNLRSIDALHH